MKFITVKEDPKHPVVLNDVLTAAIAQLEPFFWDHSIHGIVTSGERTPKRQLELILELCDRHGIDTSGITPDDVNTKNGIFVWQVAWSLLLSKGIIINPPVPAVCLYDYVNSRGENMHGKTIGQTPHAHGRAFDLSGTACGPALDDAIAAGVRVSYLIERGNGATHVDVLA